MAESTPHKKQFTTALAGPVDASVSSEPAAASGAGQPVHPPETTSGAKASTLCRPTDTSDLPAGLCEHLITDLLEQRINTLYTEHFYIQQHPVEPSEAARDQDTVHALGLMLLFDLCQTDGPSSDAANLRESLLRLQQNPVLLAEMRQVVDYLLNKPIPAYLLNESRKLGVG